MHSNYQKISDTSMPINEVEAWLDEFPHKRAENKPNGGIIRSTETVIFVNGSKANLSKKERKAAIAKAKREHRAAMRELATQERKDKIEIAKKRKEWAKGIRAQAKLKAKSKKPKPISVSARKAAIKAVLLSGKRRNIPEHSGSQRGEYETLRRDILDIQKQMTQKIVRVKSIDGDKAYYIIDNFEDFGGYINYSNVGSVKEALLSGNAVRIQDHMKRNNVKNLAALVRKIVREFGLPVNTIYNLDSSINGWVKEAKQ